MKRLLARLAGGLLVATFGIVILLLMGAPGWAAFGFSWLAYLMTIDAMGDR